MIDTHCHIYLPDFTEDLAEVLERAVNAGVTDICMPAIHVGSLEEMKRLHHPKINFHKMAGIHPCEVKNFDENETYERLFELVNEEEIIGVGETGLDYYWSTDYVEEQKRSLRMHCKIAKELKKPVILHNRESTGDLLHIIEEEQDGRLTGIWHCFNGTAEEGDRAVDLGLLLGIGGVVTFKNAGVDKTVQELPLEKMVLETDAPYLTPAPFRGKRNEPAYLKFIQDKLSGLFDMDVETIREKTSETAKKLFQL